MTTATLARLMPLDLPKGAELVTSLADLAALHSVGSFQAVGELEDVLLDAPEARTLMGRWTLLSLQGFVGPQGGPWVLLTRSTDAGPQVVGGRVAQATVVFLVGHALAPADAEQLIAARRATTPSTGPSAPRAPGSSPGHAGSPSAAPSQPGTPPYASVLPRRPERPQASEEIYPEEGDVVTHFHFGRCVVASSDGERIRLQGEKDAKVREVALSMLKIEPPTELDDGRRHFELLRKH